MVAHDSLPASYPTNVACNSPDTASHRATISLELQRLRTLLKVHPIELHAKLLQAHASCLRSSPHTWVRWYARGRRPGAYLGVGARVTGLTRIVSGSRASDTPSQAPLRPSRRLPCPQQPIVGVCYRGGLRLGRCTVPRRDLTTPNRDLTAPRRGLTAPNRGLTAIKWGELRCTGTRA